MTNKIYIVNKGSLNVTVIDGTNNSTKNVPADTNPRVVAVNSVTNKIYVANEVSDNVSVIDGTNNPMTSVAVSTGLSPWRSIQ